MSRSTLLFLVVALSFVASSAHAEVNVPGKPLLVGSEPVVEPDPEPDPEPPSQTPSGGPRGYLTTPGELADIKEKADRGREPYRSAVSKVLNYADRSWNYSLSAKTTCPGSDEPAWNDDGGGTPILYAKALAYHLRGNERYARDVKDILESLMTEVLEISTGEQQCRLNFGWGTPEIVASADLIESYWDGQTCTGPESTVHGENRIVRGDCKILFQNWLVKNPYYVVSLAASQSKSNWGAAATNATAYVADYLWDRPAVRLVHRHPRQVNGGRSVEHSPSEAFTFANQLALDRMNGYAVANMSSKACDMMDNSPSQDPRWIPVKSQISERGIVPEDARRKQSCNIPVYNGNYQNYPQIHLGNNIQQCELMLRRGDSSCFENRDMTDIPNYRFVGPKGNSWTTHLRPGRGSIERGIKAVIVDSGTQWKHDSALEIAHRYYTNSHQLSGFEEWAGELGRPTGCSQDACFGTLTHGFEKGERVGLPPTAPAP